MTVSANSSFDLSADQLCTAACRLAWGLEVTPTAGQLDGVRGFLNTLVKSLKNRGIELRMRSTVMQTLTAGTFQYAAASDTLDIIMDSAFVTSTQGVDLPLRFISINDYTQIPLKTIQSQPTQICVLRGDTSAVTLLLFPAPDANWATLSYIRVRALRDMDAGNVTGDFPTTYLRALSYMLGADVAETSGLPDKAKRLRDVGEYELAMAISDDGEKAPPRFVVDMPYRSWR